MSSIRNATFSMDRARAAFQKKPDGFTTNTFYPFHTLPEGKSSTFRFIPDADAENDLAFLVERRVHRLVDADGQVQRVPCLEMYGDDCPICKTSRQYYKAKDNVNGKKLWSSKDHLARALVVKDGLPPNPDTGETFVGKVVTLSLVKTLYDIISHTMSSGELGDAMPCDAKGGTDFIITRTVKPGPNGEKYNDYVLSKFARISRSLEEEELATLEITDADGVMPNYIALRSLLPQKPTLEFVQQALDNALMAIGGDEQDAPVARPAARPAARAPIPRQAAPTRQPAMGDDDDTPDWSAPAAPATRAAPAPAQVDDEDDAQTFLQQIKARRAAAARGE